MKALKLHGLLLGMALFLLASCTRAQEPVTTKRNDPSTPTSGQLKNKKVLIVYLTRTKNTKAVAEMIHNKTGGDLVPLELVTPYPANYQAQVAQVVSENAKGFLPSLKTKIDSIQKYDLVFVGFPTWDMQMPPPVKSFLHQYNLSGKTVIPLIPMPGMA